MSNKLYIGIDPGWKNLGLALAGLDEQTKKVSKVYTQVLNPSSFETITAFVDHLDSLILPLTTQLADVTIERFVAYNGVHSAESENINQLIGALSYYFGSSNTWSHQPNLVRAIDWKGSLVKALFKKKNFDNPSTTLDKKFSFAAAHACMDETIELATDHEADALCLACLPIYTGKGI